jgi:hypothetical protein
LVIKCLIRAKASSWGRLWGMISFNDFIDYLVY